MYRPVQVSLHAGESFWNLFKKKKKQQLSDWNVDTFHTPDARLLKDDSWRQKVSAVAVGNWQTITNYSDRNRGACITSGETFSLFVRSRGDNWIRSTNCSDSASFYFHLANSCLKFGGLGLGRASLNYSVGEVTSCTHGRISQLRRPLFKIDTLVASAAASRDANKSRTADSILLSCKYREHSRRRVKPLSWRPFPNHTLTALTHTRLLMSLMYAFVFSRFESTLTRLDGNVSVVKHTCGTLVIEAEDCSHYAVSVNIFRPVHCSSEK